MKNNKKIVFVVISGCGGAERMTILYAKILQKAGYDCSVFVSGGVNGICSLLPFIPETMPYVVRKGKFRFLWIALTKYLLKIKPDAIFTSNELLYLSALPYKFFIKPSIRLVFRECSLPHVYTKSHISLLKHTLKFSSAIIAQTEEMKKEMISYYNLKDSQITVINNPIDKDLILKDLDESFMFPETDCTHYIAVGRLHEVKDYETMIKAFSLVCESKPYSILHIVGEYRGNNSHYKQKLDELVSSLGLTDKVKFEGFQTNPFKYVYAADVYVLSSIFEGLPNAMLEAMFLGKPVAATACTPFVQQVINEGVTGYISEVGDEKMLAENMLKASRLSIPNKFVDVTHSDKQIKKLFSSTI